MGLTPNVYDISIWRWLRQSFYWIRDVGGDPTDGAHPVEFPPQVQNKYFRGATSETDGWDLGILPFGRCPAGGMAGENVDVHLHTTEYIRSVH